MPTTTSLRSIVDRQLRRWDLEEKQRGGAVRRRPVITISREFGSQGAAIGQMVAKELGFSFWDNEIVKAMSEETGVAEVLLESLDESNHSGFDDLVASALLGAPGTQREYLRQLVKIIGVIDSHGSAVIMGRGAAFVLENRCLAVRVVGTFDKLVKGYAQREGMSEAEASRLLKRKEKDRAKFIRNRFDRDIDDSRSYDIVLNTGHLTLEQSARIIIQAYEVKFGQASVAAKAKG